MSITYETESNLVSRVRNFFDPSSERYFGLILKISLTNWAKFVEFRDDFCCTFMKKLLGSPSFFDSWEAGDSFFMSKTVAMMLMKLYRCICKHIVCDGSLIEEGISVKQFTLQKHLLFNLNFTQEHKWGIMWRMFVQINSISKYISQFESKRVIFYFILMFYHDILKQPSDSLLYKFYQARSYKLNKNYWCLTLQISAF